MCGGCALLVEGEGFASEVENGKSARSKLIYFDS